MKSIVLLSIFFGACYSAVVPLRAIRGDCPAACPFIFDPICGSDGKELRSFSNDCVLNAFNCWQSRDFHALRAGLCEEDGNLVSGLLRTAGEGIPPLDLPNFQTRCKPCTRMYLPVCGFDGEEQRVFGNRCEMNYVNCMESRHFEMLRDGEC